MSHLFKIYANEITSLSNKRKRNTHTHNRILYIVPSVLRTLLVQLQSSFICSFQSKSKPQELSFATIFYSWEPPGNTDSFGRFSKCLRASHYSFLTQGSINLNLQIIFSNLTRQNSPGSTEFAWPHLWHGRAVIYLSYNLIYIIIGEEVVICLQ